MNHLAATVNVFSAAFSALHSSSATKHKLSTMTTDISKHFTSKHITIYGRYQFSVFD